MRTTLLDDLIITCEKNAGVLPAMKHMREIIRETTPVAHLWEDGISQYTGALYSTWGQDRKPESDPLPYIRYGLPADLEFPDKMMCLFSIRAVVPDYQFCIDVGVPEFTQLMGKSHWSLQGVMIFQQHPDSFEVIPLIRNDRGPVLIETQLHYQLKDNTWVYELSPKGPVNPMFHRWFMEKMNNEQRQQTNRNIERLGAVVTLYIGSYLAYVGRSGTYAIHLAKAAKYKIKDGKVKKAYKPATTGYKQFEPGKETGNETQDREENTTLAARCEPQALPQAPAGESADGGGQARTEESQACT